MSRLGRPGSGLTKTQHLREAKTSALLRELKQKETIARGQQQDVFKARKRVLREPKKVDFQRPGMTKAMIARMQAAEKVKQEYERKKHEEMIGERIPRRTPAPVGGDSRIGRERLPHARKSLPMAAASSRGAIPRSRSRPPDETVPRQTTELARMMNADVISAEPVGQGPISNIVIPPGTVNENRTTIISVPQPADIDPKETSQIANRSIQVISDALDEQDATEAEAVQIKLEDLQQARRDFVMTVANVSVNIADETPPEFGSFVEYTPPPPPPPPRQVIRVPDVESEMFQPEHGIDHPNIVAAREFLRKAKEAMAARVADRKLEEEFERIAEEVSDDLHLNVPFEEELYVDKDISWEEDEKLGTAIPVQSRVKAHASPIPQQQQTYKHKTFDPEELERFFDVERYPPCPVCGPPPGRAMLPPDLWELEDPWYKPMPEPDVPDLIEFDLIDF
ncbi:uncharacterized protein LOC117219665 [Megalopta genalis]|uniref:uncharacterized protein LOC117219665 n=1 Tax=Megalopta genalis TaxID=115081 RepID=UPI003FD09852